MKHAVHIMGWGTGPAGVFALALAGCTAVGPDYRPPASVLPEAWGSAGATNAPVAVTNVPGSFVTNDVPGLSRWWRVFNDPVLETLVECARTNNLDVRQAEARLRKARAQRELARAERMPAVGATASASRSRSSGKTGSGRTSSVYANGLDASWEADLFGGKRRAVEAAQATLEASREDLRDVLISLFSEVALNYVDYRAYQTRLAIAETNLLSQTETYEIARWRQQANLVTQVDVDQAKMSMEQTRATVPALQTGRDEAGHQLATLLGRVPGSLGALLDSRPPELPAAAVGVAAGVPADVLRRRPDVRRAERELAAQTAEIGVARAARYPDFTLSGSIGLEALTAGGLYTVAARTAQGAVGAAWTLFDGGKLRQQVAVETAYQEELFGAYQAAVLTALQEVEDALTAYANEENRRRALRDAVTAGESAFALALDKYASGLIDFETVLSTQQSLLTVQDSLVSSDAEAASDLIRLYKALGGGWEPEDGTDEREETRHENGR
jgi:NodT family efflux transporter outer membrane factor (OMF) lipoprotein